MPCAFSVVPAYSTTVTAIDPTAELLVRDIHPTPAYELNACDELPAMCSMRQNVFTSPNCGYPILEPAAVVLFRERATLR